MADNLAGNTKNSQQAVEASPKVKSALSYEDVLQVRQFLHDRMDPKSNLYDTVKTGGVFGYFQSTERVLNTKRTEQAENDLCTVSADGNQNKGVLLKVYYMQLSKLDTASSQTKAINEIMATKIEDDPAVRITREAIERTNHSFGNIIPSPTGVVTGQAVQR